MTVECEDDDYDFIDDSTYCKLCGSCMRDNSNDCEEGEEGYCDTCLASHNEDQRDIYDLTIEEFRDGKDMGTKQRGSRYEMC